MKRGTKIANLIFMFLIGILVGGYTILNIPILGKAFDKETISYQTWQENSSSIEANFKNDMVGRSQLIDLYGISLRALQKNVVGNFEYIKDGEGFLQNFFAPVQAGSPFEQSVIALQKRLKSEGIPLIYLAAPNRTEGFPLAEARHFYGQHTPEELEKFQENGIDIIYMEQAMESDPDAPSKEEFFFRTDGHYATYGEFWMCKILVEHLIEEYGIDFPQFDYVFDLGQYQIIQYDFLGGMVRSAGKYFTDYDCFESYIPTFPTDLTLLDKTGAIKRTGDFQSVLMNDLSDHGVYTYWVTNFGQWPQPLYHYENNLNPDGAKLLIIADSTFLRGNAYLSLASGKVTIADVRYAEGVQYVEQALNKEHYDAVIICNNTLWSYSFTSVGPLQDYQSEILFYNISGNDLLVTVKNTSSVEWTYQNRVKCYLRVDGQDCMGRAQLDPQTVVKPGEEVEFCFTNLDIASLSNSSVTVQMLQEGFAYFGDTMEIKFNTQE